MPLAKLSLLFEIIRFFNRLNYAKRIFAYLDYINNRLHEIISGFVSINVSSKTKDLEWKLSNLDLQRPEEIIVEEGLYEFSLPVRGEYQLIINQAPNVLDRQNDELELKYSAGSLKRPVKRIDQEWISLGTLELSEGLQSVVLPMKKEVLLENLEETFDVESPRNKYTCKNVRFPVSFTLVYNISFLYRTEIGEPINIKLIQDTDSKDSDKRPFYFVDGRVQKDASWRKYDYEYKPHKFSKEANLQFCINSSEKEPSKVSIDEFQIMTRSEPMLFLVAKTKTSRDAPKVSFKRVNQTKYFISTTNASESSYILNFNQRFDAGWKLREVNFTNDAFLESELISNNQFGQEYEDTSKVEYLITDASTEDVYSHFVNNGFNNGWIIKGGDKNFLLEYEPQIVFIKSVKVTVAGVVIVVGIIAIVRLKKKKKTNVDQ